MESEPKFHVTDAERMNEGVIIGLGDRKCAFYSAELLRSMLAHAESPEEDDLETVAGPGA
jgi:hypothetical protein